MQRKQGIILVVLCLVLASAAVAVYWRYRRPDAHRAAAESPPSPVKSAYNQISLGMSEAEVERLLPDSVEPEQGRMLAYIEWTGWVKGQAVQVRTPREPDASDHPALAKSLYVRMEDLEIEEQGKSRSVLKDAKSGEIVGTVRGWAGENDRLSVLFDKNGVAEKVYIKLR